jgi:pyruvate dehydrogenase E2 component (dihydrolipoamide acetyltransferase)
MADYRLPSLGADMDSATLVEWRIQPGDQVKKGEVVALIETSKSAMDIEFFEDGVIEEILVEPGAKVEVGTPIARFQPVAAGREAAVAEEVPVATPPPSPPPPPPPAAAAAAEAPPEYSHGYKRTHPPVRRLAEQLGVDLATVNGSGPGGRIVRADVEAAADARGEQPGVSAVPSRPPPAVAPAASPRARRIAEEHGIDLARITPSDPGGVISGEDVQRMIEVELPSPAEETPALADGSAPAETPAPPEQPAAAATPTDADRARERRLAMRKAIADLMARSKREIPHYYLVADIDLEHTLQWLEEQNTSRALQARLLPAVLLIKSVALALREVPEMNGFWIDDRFQPGDGIHTGVAVSLREGGLIAPAIHDADQKTLDELMAALRDLVTRARSGVLRRPEMTDPTITITNLGDQGVDAVYGVIYPPQVALVGFGRVHERPWTEGGMVGARRILTATLSADHRASDGHRGGIFLGAIERLLKEPEKL